MKTVSNRLFDLILLVAATGTSFGQPDKKSIQEVIDAERNFARTSREYNTRQAFLSSLGTTAHLYTRGEVVNGIEKWSHIPADSALLNWWPVLAEVSAAGDMGYTTGPFQYFRSRNDAAPAANGFYSTVWKKQPDGKWKVATDLGIGTREVLPTTESVAVPQIPGSPCDTIKATDELTSAEAKYITLLNASSVSFLEEYLASEFRVHRQQNNPVTTRAQLKQLNGKNKFTFEQVGMEMADSGDLAYTFGKVKVEIAQDNSSRVLPVNYIRVWKRIKNEWNVVLDVIGS
jgi:ketosteroid isomerase-like protein